MSTLLPSIVMPSSARTRRGFSLVEMLVVLSIASILSVLATMGFRSILGSVENSQVSDIASTLMRARAYAMANNTYVFVGIEEVNASVSSNATQTAGTGRIGVTVAASNDGTRIYTASAPSALTSSSLTVVSPLRHYDNLHITASSGIANLPNNTATGTASFNLASSSGATSSTSLTTFTWPLTGTPQYSFGNNASSPGTVIQFNPQGQAQVVNSAFTDSVFQWIEIDLIPTHGTTIATSNPATILIDGASGSVTTYRE